MAAAARGASNTAGLVRITARRRLPDLEAVYVSRAAAAPPDAIRLEDVIGAPTSWAGLPDAPLPRAELWPEDDATIFYTSGTTGRPKGAIATHRNALSNIVAAACCGARAFLRRGEEIPAPPLDGATLMTVPFFHVTGTFAILSPTLNAGFGWHCQRTALPKQIRASVPARP